MPAIEREAAAAAAEPLCWICGTNKADSGEHKTKRSDLQAVLGEPTRDRPFYFTDLLRQNRLIQGLNAEILRSPIRICHKCNTARTQPHDRAWEEMSKQLRSRPLIIDRWVRSNRIFPYDSRREMVRVQLFFLKLFGCMIEEAKAVGKEVPIEIAEFSKAIMNGQPHPDVHLMFGKYDGPVGRTNLYCFKTDGGSVLAYWAYQLRDVSVCVTYVRAREFERLPVLWHPHSQQSARRFKVADFTWVNDTSSDETS